MMSRFDNIRRFMEYISLTLLLIIIWQIVEDMGWINPVTLPSPETIANKFKDMIVSGVLLKHLTFSIIRVLKGYIIAAASALVFGILLGLSERSRRITDLVIQIMKPIPPIAWIPLVILWFGIGEESKVFLIFLGGFFTILANVMDGILQTDKKLIEVSRITETPQLKYIFQLVIPAAVPNIFTGFRVGLSSCWMCVVAAELVASSTGLGYMIMNARQFSQTDVVIVGMVTIGVLGKVMDRIIRVLEKKVIRWNK